MIQFFVAGIPKALSVGGVHIRTKAGARFSTRRNTGWAELVGLVGREHAPETPLGEAASFVATFYLPRPKNAKRRAYPLTRPDVDNLLHKLTDQFNGVFWHDDSQLVDVLGRKRFADERADGRPGVEIVVAPVEGSAAARERPERASATPLGAHRRRRGLTQFTTPDGRTSRMTKGR